MKKIFIIGVILLFLGVGIKPSYATVKPEEKIIVDSSKIQNTKSFISFSQLPFEPDEPWIFRISDAGLGYRVWDEYWNVNEPLYGITWWGLSVNNQSNSCNPEELVFEIIFWDALLGNAVYTYQVTPPAISTGKFYNGSEMFYWMTTLDPCCDLIPNGWVTIQSEQCPSNCWFLWAGSDDGDLYCYQEGSTSPHQNTDCAFQLIAKGEPAYPKIVCDPVGIHFGKTRPGTTVTGKIYIYNLGDSVDSNFPATYLNWYVDTASVPSWGTWTFTPASGTGVAEGDYVVVDVTCVVTDIWGLYVGTITVYNADNSSDYCRIDPSVEVERTMLGYNSIFLQSFERFSLLEKLLNIIFLKINII